MRDQKLKSIYNKVGIILKNNRETKKKIRGKREFKKRKAAES